MALTLIVSSLAGYGFEMFKSRFRDRIFGFLLLWLGRRPPATIGIVTRR